MFRNVSFVPSGTIVVRGVPCGWWVVLVSAWWALQGARKIKKQKKLLHCCKLIE